MLTFETLLKRVTIVFNVLFLNPL